MAWVVGLSDSRRLTNSCNPNWCVIELLLIIIIGSHLQRVALSRYYSVTQRRVKRTHGHDQDLTTPSDHFANSPHSRVRAELSTVLLYDVETRCEDLRWSMSKIARPIGRKFTVYRVLTYPSPKIFKILLIVIRYIAIKFDTNLEKSWTFFYLCIVNSK